MFIEEMLNFIFDNLFFVIILLFGLSQLFIRKTSNEGKKHPPGPLPPVAKPFFEESIDEPIEEKSQQEVQNVNEKDKSFDEEKEVLPTFEFEPNIQYVRFSDEGKSIQLEKINEQQNIIDLDVFQRPSRHEIMQAIVWSEILGPPRARKKFSNRRFD